MSPRNLLRELWKSIAAGQGRHNARPRGKTICHRRVLILCDFCVSKVTTEEIACGRQEGKKKRRGEKDRCKRSSQEISRRRNTCVLLKPFESLLKKRARKVRGRCIARLVNSNAVRRRKKNPFFSENSVLLRGKKH